MMENKSIENMFNAMEEFPSSVYYGIALGSILISAGLFLMGRRNWALFVGQWPPTIMGMALSSKLLRPSRENLGRQIGESVSKMSKAA